MCGLPFSGKSTVARFISEETAATLISFDELWKEKCGAYPTGTVDEIRWELIHSKALVEIEIALRNGATVVYDDLNHVESLRNHLRQLARTFHAQMKVIFLDIPTNILNKRRLVSLQANDRHRVKQSNIDIASAQFEVPRGKDVMAIGPDTELKSWVSTHFHR